MWVVTEARTLKLLARTVRMSPSIEIKSPKKSSKAMDLSKLFGNPSVSTFANIVLNITLVIIYGHYFGTPSVRKYLDKAVIITKDEEDLSSVALPSEI